jgi:hypothetical protein
MRRRAFLTVLGLALAGCLATAPTDIGVGQEFELAPNQTVRVSGTDLTVGFRRVVGDSRCPIDSLCVTEGTAGVEVDIFGSSAQNPVRLESTPGFNVWSDGTYEVKLLEILPSRTADATISPDQYRLRMVVNVTAS